MRRLFGLCLLLGFSLGAHADWKPGEVLVKVNPSVLIGTDQGDLQLSRAVETDLDQAGAETWSPVCQAAKASASCDLDRWFLVTCRHGITEQQLMANINILPYIETSEFNYFVYLDDLPNDPDYSKQYAWDLLEAPAAWGLIKGSSNVVVAIIDSGADLVHQDLASAIWINTDETPGNGIDDDGNSYIDDFQGWDFDGNDNNPSNVNADNDHGTHVAGIVGAVSNNGIGVAGGTWGCPVMILKVFPNNGGGATVGNVASAIRYAADNEALVANLSLGSNSYSQIQADAVLYAYNAGVTVVAAAGNGGNDGIGDSTPHYPSANEGVIGVGSVNRFNEKDGSSNYGEGLVDIFSPGVSIRSTLPGNAYGNLSGTSMASPVAAALAALIKSQNPGFTPDEILQRMQQGCEPIDYSNPSYRGELDPGRINYFFSVADAPVIRIKTWLVDDSSGNMNYEADVGETVSFNLELMNYSWMDATNVTATISASAGVTISTAVASFGDIASRTYETNLTSFVLTVTETTHTDLAINVTITADGGYSQIETLQLPVNNPLPQMPGFPVAAFGGYNASARVADLDNDGNMEIITASNDGMINVFRHDGSYYPGWPVSIGSKIYLDSILILAAPSVADIDLDGDLEIIVSDQMTNVTWINPNDPTQGSKSRVLGRIHVFNSDGTAFGGSWPFITDIPFTPEGSDPIQAGFKCGPTIANVAGDSKPEIITGNYANVVYVFDYLGNVLSGWPKDVGTDVFASASTYDFDADGLCDIVIATKADVDPLDSGSIYLFNGSGELFPGFPVAAPNQVYSVPVLADMDSDGIPEIVFGYGDYANELGSKGVMVMDMLSRPLPGWPVSITNSIYGAPAIGDLDQDGFPDIAVCTVASEVFALQRDGSILSGFPVQVSADPDSSINSSPAIADINNDGHPEILFCSEIGFQTAAYLHIIRSDGTLFPDTPIQLNHTGFSSPCVADIDNDGDQEIIVTDGTTAVFNTKTAYDEDLQYWTTYHGNNASTGVYSHETPIETGVNLMITRNMFNNGDPFSLEMVLTNGESTPYQNLDIFVILDVYSMYWFYPSWSETADWLSYDLLVPGTTKMNVMNFTWPSVGGTAENLIFWGGMLDQNGQLAGRIDYVTFGYGL